jgi:probable F420-dependent oxidoreductase
MTIAGDIKVGFVAGGEPRKVPALEELPIDSLWVGGHVASRNPTSEAMVSLARLSAVTERVQIGTSILLLPLYPPAIVAKQIADLDRVTGGRLVLGVGVGGEYPQEFRACQVPLEERGKRTNEAIPLLRRLWTGEEINHDGPFYEMHDVKIHPAPTQPGGPPIIVAGRQEVAMRRAVRHGDGWMPYLYSPRRYAASLATIAEIATAEGRDLSGFGYYAFVFVNVDPDGDAAREGAAAFMGGNYNQDFRQMVDNVAAAGTPAEVTAKLLAFVDAGARHFIFTPATRSGNTDTIIDRLLGEVIPAVRTELDSRPEI